MAAVLHGMSSNYEKTLSRLQSLQQLLKCKKCKEVTRSLYSLGGCEHMFCRSCCDDLLGKDCPVCFLPADVRDAMVNRPLSNVAGLSLELMRLITGDLQPSRGHKVNHLTDEEVNDLSGQEVNDLSGQEVNDLSGQEVNHLSEKGDNLQEELESTPQSNVTITQLSAPYTNIVDEEPDKVVDSFQKVLPSCSVTSPRVGGIRKTIGIRRSRVNNQQYKSPLRDDSRRGRQNNVDDSRNLNKFEGERGRQKDVDDSKDLNKFEDEIGRGRQNDIDVSRNLRKFEDERGRGKEKFVAVREKAVAVSNDSSKFDGERGRERGRQNDEGDSKDLKKFGDGGGRDREDILTESLEEQEGVRRRRKIIKNDDIRTNSRARRPKNIEDDDDDDDDDDRRRRQKNKMEDNIRERNQKVIADDDDDEKNDEDDGRRRQKNKVDVEEDDDDDDVKTRTGRRNNKVADDDEDEDANVKSGKKINTETIKQDNIDDDDGDVTYLGTKIKDKKDGDRVEEDDDEAKSRQKDKIKKTNRKSDSQSDDDDDDEEDVKSVIKETKVTRRQKSKVGKDGRKTRNSLRRLIINDDDDDDDDDEMNKTKDRKETPVLDSGIQTTMTQFFDCDDDEDGYDGVNMNCDDDEEEDDGESQQSGTIARRRNCSRSERQTKTPNDRSARKRTRVPRDVSDEANGPKILRTPIRAPSNNSGSKDTNGPKMLRTPRNNSTSKNLHGDVSDDNIEPKIPRTPRNNSSNNSVSKDTNGPRIQKTLRGTTTNNNRSKVPKTPAEIKKTQTPKTPVNTSDRKNSPKTPGNIPDRKTTTPKTPGNTNERKANPKTPVNTSDRKTPKTPASSCSRKTRGKQVTTPVNRAPVDLVTLSHTPDNGTPLSTSRTRSSERQGKLGKRNARGETLLHVAAIKGDYEKAEELVKNGCGVNLRDHAGWTPLHEAVNHGHVKIAELLLDNGAMINSPGLDNDTPLHDAINNNRLDCTRLLVTRGASLTLRNIHGLTARDIATTEPLRQALQTPVDSQFPSTSDHTSMMEEEDYSMLCFLGTALSREQRIQLQKCANILHAAVVEDFCPEVTHVITSCNNNGACPRTIKYLRGILSGVWIVNMSWITTCQEYGYKVCEEIFEIPGSSTNPDSRAPLKGRMNRKQQLPGLFDGCQFYFHGVFEYPTPEKHQLMELVRGGGGRVLTREPKLQNLDEYPVTVPYHAGGDSRFRDCSIFIVHDTHWAYPPINATRMCAVPASWLLETIGSFSFRSLD